MAGESEESQNHATKQSELEEKTANPCQARENMQQVPSGGNRALCSPNRGWFWVFPDCLKKQITTATCFL